MSFAHDQTTFIAGCDCSLCENVRNGQCTCPPVFQEGYQCAWCKAREAETVCYVLHWRYNDGSGAGVLPRLLIEEERELLILLGKENCLSSFKTIEIIEIKVPV